MSGWAGFWQVVIWSAMLLYFSLAVVIAVGGFFGVRKMFRRLAEQMRAEAANKEKQAEEPASAKANLEADKLPR